MKYFKFWIKESFDINVGETNQHINILSGSNLSKSDARDQARKQSKLIENRISNGNSEEEYEVPIKEHVLEVIDDSNIVTVCRYGAKILNTTQYTFLDLDDYPTDFWDFFKPVNKMAKKERIVFKFLEKVKKYPEVGDDFRIYETNKGIRVIGKKYLNPSDHVYISLMKKFAVDWLYVLMSKRQSCFRARLTPKPYRMRIKTIKISSPMDCEMQEYSEWSKIYEAASRNYAVVKHIKSVGKDFSNESVIKLHDLMCNANTGYILA
jgi:hypothetical protein